MTTFPHTYNTEKVLGSSQKNFYSLDWEPYLAPILPVHDSTEPVSSKNHPLTYTTVGSLVNPKAIFQFSAPNRIQREGASRRPLMSILANRNFDSVFQSCERPFSLNMSDQKEFAPISRSPSHLEKELSSIQEVTLSPKNLSTPSPNYDRFLTVAEQEDNFLTRHFNGKLTTTSEIKKPKNYLESSPHQHSEREIVGMDLEGKTVPTSVKIQTPVQGLEKMQTLQRLSKFSNPIQEWARNKLSEFAVTKQLAQDVSNTGCCDLHSLSQSQTMEDSAKIFSSDGINLDSRVPMTAGTPNSMENHHQGVTYSSLPTNRPAQLPSYLRPLAAGPHSQRHFNIGLNPHSASFENLHRTQYRTANYDSHLNHQRSSPQFQEIQSQPECFLPWAGQTSSELVDTISQEDAAQYYPYAWPSGPNEIAASHSTMRVDLSKSETPGKHQIDLNDWFYSGQKRFAMIATLTLKEESTYQRGTNDDMQASSLQEPDQHPIRPQRISVMEINQKSSFDCIAPMIDMLLITLLEYANGQTLGPRAILSNYVKFPKSQFEANGQDDVEFSDNEIKMTYM